jgi:hypothetical protein
MSGNDTIADIIKEAITGKIVSVSRPTQPRLFDNESSIKPNPISVQQIQEFENMFYRL